MTDPACILAAYDVSGIQEYIFATSRLRENIGASRIVSRILQKELPQALEKVLGREHADTSWQTSPSFRMPAEPALRAEIIYIGGGVAVVAYRSAADYDQVNRELAKRVLEESYTLTLIAARIKSKGHYGEDLQNLNIELGKTKQRMSRLRPLGALPIVEQEGLTGLPIAERNGKDNISLLQKLKYNAQKSTENEICQAPVDYRFATEAEELIQRRGEESYIAVVHIDGNGMSNAIRRQIQSFGEYGNAVPRMRELSRHIARIYQAVFDGMVKEMLSLVEAKRESISLRPLIMDGDDITFLCEGGLGIPLAAYFLRYLAQKKEKIGDTPLSVCAGVALVHSHFPFSIAYEIAENCCRNAKKKRLAAFSGPQADYGYLDFHLVRGAYVCGIQEQREKDRQREKPRMQRPYCVTAWPDTTVDDSLDSLLTIVKELLETERPQQGKQIFPRSRLKALYEAYLRDDGQTDVIVSECVSRGHRLSVFPPEGAALAPSPLFDALELMDLFDKRLLDILHGRKEEVG